VAIWEYAELMYSITLVGENVYIAYSDEDGQIRLLRGFKSGHKVLEALTELGAEGWELVAAATGMGQVGPQTQTLWLKRQKQR